METKVCSKCKEEKPRTREYFPHNKRSKDGFDYWCRKCHSVASVNTRKKKPKKYKEYDKKHNKEYRKTLRGYISHLVSHIQQRCTNPNNIKYKYYGGRGIQYKFTPDELFSWVVANNIEPRGHDIHRIDNDSNYTLDNIEFLEHGLHTSLHKSKW